jgi:hypothetical protein
MNILEKQMVDILKDLRDNHHVISVKAEFEAEGTRIEEAMRLKEVSLRADLNLTIKIGGCEAVKDMFEATSLGTKYLVAPMVETAYALKKYMHAIKIAFTEEQQNDMQFLVNIETKAACDNFEEMLAIPEIAGLSGIVLGRVDLSGSLDLSREDINSSTILERCLITAQKANAHGLDVVVGGGVSYHSLPFFKSFPPGHLNRFETRKIVFSCPEALANDERTFLKAIEFELLWLKNKKNYYGTIHIEDDVRLTMLEKRYRSEIETI